MNVMAAKTDIHLKAWKAIDALREFRKYAVVTAQTAQKVETELVQKLLREQREELKQMCREVLDGTETFGKNHWSDDKKDYSKEELWVGKN